MIMHHGKPVTLRDWLPEEFFLEFQDVPANKHLDQVLIEEFGCVVFDGKITHKQDTWPGTHKNVINWVKLDNGYAVGWNENPSVGWSFPVVKIK